ncbi:MAG: trimethyllysine dioxygenase [Alphaproteobacteria bacterium]|nr:trimethyllysine dioxygenase [Alphaproteobacteria bacterium]
MTELRLLDARPTDAGLRVRWAGSEGDSTFPWFWLCDHGEDEGSLDPRTLQRRVDTFAIPADIHGVDVRIEEGGDRLAVIWNNGQAASEYSAEFLAAIADLAPSPDHVGAEQSPAYWTAADAPDPLPMVANDGLLADDRVLREMLVNIYVWGLCVVDGVPATVEATAAIANRVGYVRRTIFGGVSTLSAELEEHADTAYSTEYLEPHTDATYSHDAPGLQMFNCAEFDGSGGESILVDGFAVARSIAADAPASYETLTRVIVPGRYVEPGVYLNAERAPLRLDSRGELVQITFNNYDRAPFCLPEPEMTAFYQAYGELHRRLCDQANWLKIRLRPGMALIFNNWRVLHGRMSYTGKRVFHGCYVNREDYESRLRVLRFESRD